MKTLLKLMLPLIVGSATVLTACHHHDNRRSVPQRPIPGYNHNSHHTPKHRYNNLNDYNNDTLTPYERMW